MADEAAPDGARVSASSSAASERIAEALATALCELDGAFHAGDILVVTARDGVHRGKLRGGGLEALLEHLVGAGAGGGRQE